MARKLYPIGIQGFETLRQSNFYYVDKTAYIHLLATSGKYYFLSRPRRFGKSLLISTLEAYFQGKRELFAGLAIEQMESEWVEYPVLHIDFNAKNYQNAESLYDIINRHLEKYEALYGDEKKNEAVEERFVYLIETAHKKTGRQAVVLVDEYDKPLLNTIDNPDLQQQYRDILKAFYGVLKTMDNHIRFGRCEHGTAVTLELGTEVAEMSRSESSGTYANRIYAFGGDRNIPADYRPTTEQTVVNGVVQHRLMLPEGTPYADARPGLTEAEIVEAVKVFDDIYPKRTGTMSDVHTRTGTVTNDDGTQTTYTYYRYKDTGLVFKDEYILPGKELQIVFTSGKLNGMTFGVIFNPTPKDSARGEQLWEIVANEDYGRLLPDDTLKPEDGDTYILSGFDIQMVSDQYIPDAEQELLEAAQEYVRKSGVDDGSYQAALYSDWVYADRIGRTFDIGQKVLLKNPAYFGAEGRESRITGWELNLDLPYDSPRYTIGESVQYSRLGSIEDSLEALTYKGQTYTGGGGSGVYVIRTNDTTPASDSNVFSALRSLRQFTRKDIDDIVAGLLSFAKGLQSTGYTSGSLGTGFGLLKDVDGMSYLEIDRIYARYKAIFDNLEVKHVSHVGGEFVVSPAGMKCIRVETVTASPVAWQSFADSKGRTVTDKSGRRFSTVSRRGTVYRCFFRSTDGERTIENQFSVGDQAMCREFNLTGGSVNRYYWRKVISVPRNTNTALLNRPTTVTTM